MNSSTSCAPFLPSPPIVFFSDEAANRGRILQVDDDPLTSQVICAWLSYNGYEAIHASGTAEADELVARMEFDVIISDIHMPGNNGLEWVERQLQRPCPPPIILLTGQPAYESACRAANLVVAGYLVKPPDFSLLKASLPRLVSEQRQRTEFVRVSHDILGLLSAYGANGLAQEGALVERLAALTQRFAARFASGMAGGAAAPVNDEAWRNAIRETIVVIEKTKHSFR